MVTLFVMSMSSFTFVPLLLGLLDSVRDPQRLVASSTSSSLGLSPPLSFMLKTGLKSLMSIRFLGCLPMPAWAVLAESVSYAKRSALLRVVYLSIILINIDSSEKSIPS